MKDKVYLWSLGTLVFLLAFIFISPVHAKSVEVFNEYDTTVSLNSESVINVSKSLSIKNVQDVGVVPGQIEFKISKSDEGAIDLVSGDKVKAVDQFGNKINTHVRKTEDFTAIILDIYHPLMPGFTYSFNLSYPLSYDPGGIFFKNLNVPVRESTIPIKEGKFRVKLPSSYSFSYTSEDFDENVEISENVAVWDIKKGEPEKISFEYSYIPINIGKFRGSYVFWITLNLLLAAILALQIRKEIRSVKSGKKKK